MSNSDRSFALVFQQTVPSEILLLFDGYVEDHNGLKLVYCQNPSYDAWFVSVQLLKTSNGELWEVQIPHGFVLAIVDASQDRPSIGFVRSSQ